MRRLLLLCISRVQRDHDERLLLNSVALDASELSVTSAPSNHQENGAQSRGRRTRNSCRVTAVPSDFAVPEQLGLAGAAALRAALGMRRCSTGR